MIRGRVRSRGKKKAQLGWNRYGDGEVVTRARCQHARFRPGFLKSSRVRLDAPRAISGRLGAFDAEGGLVERLFEDRHCDSHLAEGEIVCFQFLSLRQLGRSRRFSAQGCW
jgi:hypothetical protein